ncbi:restriction endonuclease subunit S [Microbacterium jejuense]|uniref:Restriction endonuclease subunit S n=1 Tax=Microbacterium jejuense TaxID=1263637 RepID=A0ABS7HLN0_9MICO|nr:restriction endonuclease subunit S [Microbacterium jejuense]MBW9093325.1 restriction endonuclease subunit S [Microbacterium jejuense]
MKIGSGATPRGGEAVYQSHGVSLIRSQNVLDNAMRVDDIAHISDDAAEALRGVTVEPGDVLINITGDSVARCAVVDPSILPARVNQHVAIIRPGLSLNSLFLQKLLVAPKMKTHLLTIATGGGTRNALTKSQLSGLHIPLPRLSEQQAIAEVLGALDDKIAANTALAATAAAVASTELRATIRAGALELSIDEVSILLARGITPRYLPDGEGTRVLNQKCVRDQVVSLEPSRWTDDSKVKQEKLIAVGDVLVNSTGQGTLGRVARWTLQERATVDSHVTIVRPNPDVSDPAVIGQAILAIEADIEALGEGSTGQTELSRVELGRARIRIPSRDRADRLGATLRALSARSDAARSENVTLAATRDALLPQLMSGRLRVRDAEAAASEAGV